MDTERWTEVFRRGQDANGMPLDAGKHLRFDTGMDNLTNGFGDPAIGEFYIGKPLLDDARVQPPRASRI